MHLFVCPNHFQVCDLVLMIWTRANLLTYAAAVVAERIERLFSGRGLAAVIGKQTLTGNRRPTKTPQEADTPNDRNTRNRGKSDGKVVTSKVRKWAGTRKRKGETKKSLAAKSRLPLLFDIAKPDHEQDVKALPLLLDARGDRKLHIPNQTEATREETEEAICEEANIEDPFRSVGQFVLVLCVCAFVCVHLCVDL